eukprot:4796929-Amphidinium_carterae.1
MPRAAVYGSSVQLFNAHTPEPIEQLNNSVVSTTFSILQKLNGSIVQWVWEVLTAPPTSNQGRA